MSKKTLNSFIRISDKIKTTVISGDLDNSIAGTKWKIEVEGEFKNMQNNDGFSKKQLEQLSQLMDTKIQPIQQDIIEMKQDIQILKSLHKDDLKLK